MIAARTNLVAMVTATLTIALGMILLAEHPPSGEPETIFKAVGFAGRCRVDEFRQDGKIYARFTPVETIHKDSDIKLDNRQFFFGKAYLKKHRGEILFYAFQRAPYSGCWLIPLQNRDDEASIWFGRSLNDLREWKKLNAVRKRGSGSSQERRVITEGSK